MGKFFISTRQKRRKCKNFSCHVRRIVLVLLLEKVTTPLQRFYEIFLDAFAALPGQAIASLFLEAIHYGLTTTTATV
jgi:hypothetical protein